MVYALENDCKVSHAEEVIAADEYDEEKLIVYDPNRKGFYAQRHKYEPIDIHLLDTAVERFGCKGDTQDDYRFVNTASVYATLDEGHFTVEATVEVSDQFYGWLLGFGKKGYLDKIRGMY